MTPQEKAEYLLKNYILDFSIKIAETRRMVAIADNALELAEYWDHVYNILIYKN